MCIHIKNVYANKMYINIICNTISFGLLYVFDIKLIECLY